MRAREKLTAALLLFGVAACAGPDGDVDEASSGADVVYVNGDIWTGVPDAPRAAAIAVKDERIAYVGDAAGAESHKGPDTDIVDLDGAFTVPGLIDNHTHFLAGGRGLASVNLRDASSPGEFTGRIAAFAETVPAGRWIRYGDWDHEAWGGELPHKDWIDDVTRENPVFVTRLDGHMGLANSLALARAGVTANTPDPDGGAIVRDDNGEPTGVLKDAAMALVLAAAPPPSDEENAEALAAAQAHALARGVTQIHDMGDVDLGDIESLSLPVYRRAHADGALKLRIYAFTPLASWARLTEFIHENGRGDDRLRWGGLKGFVDGSLGSTTAWFYEPYDDAPETNGLTVVDLDDLDASIAGASAAGLHVAVHAIGDQANDWLLAAFERAGGQAASQMRFRIEHAQHLSPGAAAAFARLGVVAAAHPYHAIDDGRWAEKRIGADRIARTYAFRSLLDAGAVLSFGSDWTVAPLDPLLGIYAAATRRTIDGANPEGWVPAQKITVEEALRAYTSGSAYAGLQEDDLGTLETGKLADFVVLSDDILAIDPVAIADVSVLRTIIGGETVFLKED